MRQVFQKSYLSKELCVEEVPAPILEGTGVLVRNTASLISAGTERATVSFARKGLIAKVRSQPERMQLLMRKVRQVGLLETVQLTRRKLENPIPMGYSTAGTVTATSPDMPGIRIGDRVACAGARYGNHADVVYIPKNLCVPLPDALSFEEGAFVAPGAIALHGLRLAQVGLGETVLVIGLGLIGQLAAQLAAAQGAVVLGIDLDDTRLELARELGCQHAFHRHHPGLQDAVLALSGGRGVDTVLIAAATASDDPVYLAGELCRERGTVVIIGDVGMQIPRSLYYQKELFLQVARSYGPGRYDDAYELAGRDYPAAYVRWTERDNMSAFLQLAADGRVRLQPLIQHRFSVQEAGQAYDLLMDPDARRQPLGIVLTYPETETPNDPQLVLRPQVQPLNGQIGLSVIGTGNFLTGTLLPLLKKQPGFAFRGAASHSGLSAKNAGAQGTFAFCTTDFQRLLDDPQTGAVIIATRHDSHADLLCRALEGSKHVFLEKPLATDRDELSRCLQAMQAHPECQVMIGFNRRFAPLSIELKRTLERVSAGQPLRIHYRVLAGRIPEDNWVHAHGGRVIGEVCHFIDYCAFLTGSTPISVSAEALGSGKNQDITVTLTFADGSVARIDYLMRIDPATAAALGKERVDVTVPGLLAELDDFKTLRLAQGGKIKTIRRKQDKGHAAELQAFAQALQSGKAPISAESIALTTEATLAILDAIRAQAPVSVSLAHYMGS